MGQACATARAVATATALAVAPPVPPVVEEEDEAAATAMTSDAACGLEQIAWARPAVYASSTTAELEAEVRTRTRACACAWPPLVMAVAMALAAAWAPAVMEGWGWEQVGRWAARAGCQCRPHPSLRPRLHTGGCKLAQLRAGQGQGGSPALVTAEVKASASAEARALLMAEAPLLAAPAGPPVGAAKRPPISGSGAGARVKAWRRPRSFRLVGPVVGGRGSMQGRE